MVRIPFFFLWYSHSMLLGSVMKGSWRNSKVAVKHLVRSLPSLRDLFLLA